MIRIKPKIEVSKKGLLPLGASVAFWSSLPRCVCLLHADSCADTLLNSELGVIGLCPQAETHIYWRLAQMRCKYHDGEISGTQT